MKPFFVLLIVFAIVVGFTFFIGDLDYGLAGRTALSAMLLFTAIGHFKFTDGMTLMIPEIIPFKKPIIYLTGFMEIAAAFLMFFEVVRKATGWCLIVFFVLLLPANINAAFRHINYEKGTYDGPGLKYLWFRVPFQLLLIWWTYFFLIRP